MSVEAPGISVGVSTSSSLAADRSVVSSETQAGEAITWESDARDRLAKIDVMRMRLRSALTDWADDDLLIARLEELEREAEPLRETLGTTRPGATSSDTTTRRIASPWISPRDRDGVGDR